MDTENRLTAVRGKGVVSWARRVKGLSNENTGRLMDTDHSVVTGKERVSGEGEVEDGKWEQMVMEGNLIGLVNTQYSTQMIYCGIVPKKFY